MSVLLYLLTLFFSAFPTKDDLVKAYGPLLIETIVAKHTLAKYVIGYTVIVYILAK